MLGEKVWKCHWPSSGLSLMFTFYFLFVIVALAVMNHLGIRPSIMCSPDICTYFISCSRSHIEIQCSRNNFRVAKIGIWFLFFKWENWGWEQLLNWSRGSRACADIYLDLKLNYQWFVRNTWHNLWDSSPLFDSSWI